MFIFFAIVVLVTMSMGGTEGWFLDNFKGRPLDGTLRCYQCNSNSKKPEDKLAASLCSITNWKRANVSEKRNMIMQCPRRKSAFCFIVVREEDPRYAVRGCYGPNYDGSGEEAHDGCFHMDQPKPLRRACLCDSILCNGLPTSSPPQPWTLFTLLLAHCWRLSHNWR